MADPGDEFDAYVERLRDLGKVLRQDPVRAKHELMKHLDGDLIISPLPTAEDGGLRAEITGQAKASSLLASQEAAFVRLVAGAGFEPAAFGL